MGMRRQVGGTGSHQRRVPCQQDPFIPRYRNGSRVRRCRLPVPFHLRLIPKPFLHRHHHPIIRQGHRLHGLPMPVLPLTRPRGVNGKAGRPCRFRNRKILCQRCMDGHPGPRSRPKPLPCPPHRPFR